MSAQPARLARQYDMRPPNRFGRAPRKPARRSLSSARSSVLTRPRAARPSAESLPATVRSRQEVPGADTLRVV